MGFWRIVFTIILPPLGVLLGKGFGWAFILNILLTLLGYIPGLIHAFLGSDASLITGHRRRISAAYQDNLHSLCYTFLCVYF
ncbi:Uncharacterized homolog of Blt101 [Salmonella enterica subsp. enterica]|uniref:Uncharacterized homolog of Blt101 n=1 Tax=Salmonella enterica I TaxID=59201 RepID=A0A379VKZ4_SALET|nr:Uncharacterized homolog of Blt101 [Salmonella enterica subsp. enterica]